MSNNEFKAYMITTLTDENGLMYHAYNFFPYEPLYEHRFIFVQHFHYGNATVAKDVNGELIINEKGENILGTERCKLINHHIIRKCDKNEITQGFDMFTGSIGKKRYLFLYDNGKCHSINFELGTIVESDCIYYPNLNLLKICYDKMYPQINMSRSSQILLDLNTKKQVGLSAKEKTLVYIRNCDECVELFEFKEKISYHESNYYYGLASENFEHIYHSKEAAMKAVLSFDYLNKDETIQL